MAFDLGNLLQSQLGDVLGGFLASSGEPAESSTKAAGLALPAVVAGLLKHIGANPSNASGVLDLLTGTSGSILDGAVAKASSAEGVGGLLETGKKLLPELLGGNAANVADRISQESGVSKAASGSLLALSLPLVLSVLRGKAKDNNLQGSQILGLLGQQQGWLSQALSSDMLSALGIGSLSGLFGSLSGLAGNFGSATAAGTAAVAGATAAAKKGGFGKWIILGIAALAALFAFKCCNTGGGHAPTETAASAAEASEPEDGAVSAVETSAPVMPTSAVLDEHETEPAAASEAAASPVSAPAADTSQAAASPVSAPAADTSQVVMDGGVAKFFFATGKNDVAEGAEQVVADLIEAGKDGKKLVISGFADSTGNAASNQELSKKRAQAVQAFFEAHGVKSGNIELRKPKSTTGAEGNDAEGRRVEVKVEG